MPEVILLMTTSAELMSIDKMTSAAATSTRVKPGFLDWP
jgi:hypothetical protein